MRDPQESVGFTAKRLENLAQALAWFLCFVGSRSEGPVRKGESLIPDTGLYSARRAFGFALFRSFRPGALLKHNPG